MGQEPAKQKKPDRMFPDAAEAAPERMNPDRSDLSPAPDPSLPTLPGGANQIGTAIGAQAGQSVVSQFARPRGAFGPNTDPTNRESLMQNLANRPAAPTMQAGQAAGTTVGAPGQVAATGQIQAGQIAGPGRAALGGMAQGQISAGMQAQNDQMLRAIQAQQAGVRGSQNVGLGARIAGEQMGRAGAQLSGIAAERQMQAAGMDAQLAAQQAQMEQGASTEQARLEQDRAIQNARMEQETTVLQAQLQQSLNLSNADMQQKANEINLNVETQLGVERDKRINELMQMGVDEEIARMRAEEEAWKFKSELTFNYWNAAVQDALSRDVARSEEAWTPTGAREELAGGAAFHGGEASGAVANSSEKNEPVYPVNQGVKRQNRADVGESLEEPIGQDYLDLMGDKPWDSPPGRVEDPTMGGQPTAFGDSNLEESLMEESANRDMANEARQRVDDVLGVVGDVKKYGGAAYDILSRDESKEAVLDLARSEAEGLVGKGLTAAGYGNIAGPAVQAGSLGIDTIQSGEPKTLAQGAAGIAGTAGGGYLGGLLGGALGSVAGPWGTGAGASLGKAAGGALGGMAASGLNQAIWGDEGQPGDPDPKKPPYVDIGEKLESLDISPETEIGSLHRRINKRRRSR